MWESITESGARFSSDDVRDDGRNPWITLQECALRGDPPTRVVAYGIELPPNERYFHYKRTYSQFPSGDGETVEVFGSWDGRDATHMLFVGGVFRSVHKLRDNLVEIEPFLC